MEDFDIQKYGTAIILISALLMYFYKRVSLASKETSQDVSLTQKTRRNSLLVSFFLTNCVTIWKLGIGAFIVLTIIVWSPGLFFTTLLWTIAFPSSITLLCLPAVTLREISFLTFPSMLYVKGNLRTSVDLKKAKLLKNGVEEFLRELPDLLQENLVAEVLKKLYFFAKYSIGTLPQQDAKAFSGPGNDPWLEDMFKQVFCAIHCLPNPADEKRRIIAIVKDFDLPFYNLPPPCKELLQKYL